MAYNQNKELQGSVRKIAKHPLHKVLHKPEDIQETLLVQSDMQGEDALDEHQKLQQIKQDLADQKGVAVTSEEHAIEFEKKAQDLKVKSDDEVEKEIEQDEQTEQLQQQQREVQLAKQAVKQSQKEELLSKIQKEIEVERERAKLLFMMENSRKNAIDAARAKYGNKADIGAIQQSYDMLANNIDPKVNDITDMISMTIDNKLHGKECVKMLMPNGSIRSMDADVAFAMSEIPNGKVEMKETESVPEDVQDVSDGLNKASFYTVEELEALSELRDLMDKNAKKQALFEYKDPSSGAVEIKSKREQRFRQLGLPTVAMDYDYVYHLAETMQHNGRELPSAMSAYAMQPGIQGDGKTYGYYQ